MDTHVPSVGERRGHHAAMSNQLHDARLMRIPAEHVDYLRDLVERRGSVKAARIVGLSRSTLWRVLGLQMAMPGTAALIREAIRQRDAASR